MVLGGESEETRNEWRVADSTLGIGEGKDNPATVGQISQAYYDNEFADLNSRQQKKMVATTY